MTSSSKECFEHLGAGWDSLQARFFSERLRDKALSVAEVKEGRFASLRQA